MLHIIPIFLNILRLGLWPRIWTVLKNALCTHENSVNLYIREIYIYQFRSVAQSCPTLCDPKNCSTPGFPVHHQFPEPAQTHVHWVSDAIQPSHSLSFLSPPAFNLSQHQDLVQWVSSLHQVAKVLKFQLQHQSFQWIFRADFFYNWLVLSLCSPRDSQQPWLWLDGPLSAT